MNFALMLRKAPRSEVQIFYLKKKKYLELLLMNHSCVCHKVSMLWGNRYYMSLDHVCKVKCQHFLQVQHKACRGFHILIIELKCRRKLEANLLGVRFGETCSGKNEKGVLWVWKGEKSVLHVEDWHGNCATILEQEYTSQILAAT